MYAVSLIYIALCVLTFLAETKSQNILVGIGWIGCTATLIAAYALAYHHKKSRTNRKL